MAVLDTSFLIDLDESVAEALAALKILAQAEILLPFQTASEYLAGVEDPYAALQALEASYTLLRPDSLHLLECARIAHGLRRRPPWGDIHIAAVAQLEGTYVVTADAKGFRALGCAVWDYRNDAKPPV